MRITIFYGLLFVITISTVNTFPVDNANQATILRYENDNIGVDGYKFAFETSDGTQRQEQGELKNPGTEQEAISVTGSVSWVADDGQTYSFTYLADENGYQPEGAHLPQPL